MFAWLASVFFALALVLSLIGQGGKWVLVFLIAGALGIALHLALGVGWPARRTPG